MPDGEIRQKLDRETELEKTNFVHLILIDREEK
jgi:hypothetical protein